MSNSNNKTGNDNNNNLKDEVANKVEIITTTAAATVNNNQPKNDKTTKLNDIHPKKAKNIADSGEETEGEDEMLEESPTGRWTKRKERVRVLFSLFNFTHST